MLHGRATTAADAEYVASARSAAAVTVGGLRAATKLHDGIGVRLSNRRRHPHMRRRFVGVIERDGSFDRRSCRHWPEFERAQSRAIHLDDDEPLGLVGLADEVRSINPA